MADETTSPAHPEPDEAVRTAARSGEPDRYIAALLSRGRSRRDLIALAAFGSEIARIPALVSDPAIGEIRLAWWREEIEHPKSGRRTGNVFADALLDVRDRHKLPVSVLVTYIDAHASLLYADPPDSDPALERVFDAKEGSLFRLAAQIGAPELVARHQAGFDEAARVYGWARLLLGMPRHYAGGFTRLPGDRLDHYRRETRARFAILRPELVTMPRALRTVLLPLALVEPYLRASEKAEHTGPTSREQLLPLIRTYRIWMAHRFARF